MLVAAVFASDLLEDDAVFQGHVGFNGDIEQGALSYEAYRLLRQ